MDDIDREMLALLRDNARLPVASLSAALGVSRATARARLDRLVADNVIKGFTVTVGTGDDGTVVRAVTMIEVEGKATDRVLRVLSGFPEVRELHSTNGRWDLVAVIETRTLRDFDDTLRRVRLVDGITLTESSILLASRKLT